MTVIDAVLLTAAVCFAVSHFAPRLWAMLPKTKLIDRFRQIEAEAKTEASTVGTKLKKELPVISETVQNKLNVLGAAISNWKSQAEAAQKALTDKQAEIDAAAAKQGELDAANGHIADLTSQLATVQAAFDAEKQNHADDEAALSALAEQVAPQ